MLEPSHAIYALEHCSKYPSHDLKHFIKLSLICEHIILNDCCLVQYQILNNDRIIHHILFDSNLCDFKTNTYKNIRKWFNNYNNVYMFEPISNFNKILGIM